jgi:hypothetical protein
MFKIVANAESEITFEELEEAVMPLAELLRKKGDPHTTAIVTGRSVTICQDVMGISLPYDD